MREKRGLGGWTFFAVACAAYGATFTIAPSLARQALASFLPMLASLGPVLLLVFLLMLLFDLFLTGDRIESWLGPGAGARGWVLAAMAGVLSTGPIYPWYGILAELRRLPFLSMSPCNSILYVSHLRRSRIGNQERSRTRSSRLIARKPRSIAGTCYSAVLLA